MVSKRSMLKYTDIKDMTSPQLIDLLASMGFGSLYSTSDTRTARIAEYGEFTVSRVCYAKIVVSVKNDVIDDYGARVIIDGFS